MFQTYKTVSRLALKDKALSLPYCLFAFFFSFKSDIFAVSAKDVNFFSGLWPEVLIDKVKSSMLKFLLRGISFGEYILSDRLHFSHRTPQIEVQPLEHRWRMNWQWHNFLIQKPNFSWKISFHCQQKHSTGKHSKLFGCAAIQPSKSNRLTMEKANEIFWGWKKSIKKHFRLGSKSESELFTSR